MLLQKKRVAVVSNNNSATANVLEKLQTYELDFVTAFLGSAQNKQAFIEGQTGTTVRMPTLNEAGQEDSVREEIHRLNQELDKKFTTKNELAAVIQQIDVLWIELTYFEGFQQETKGRDSNATDRTFRPKISARKLMNSWLACEREAERHANADVSPLSSATLSSNASFDVSSKNLIPYP